MLNRPRLAAMIASSALAASTLLVSTAVSPANAVSAPAAASATSTSVAAALPRVPRPNGRLATVAQHLNSRLDHGGQCKAFVQMVHSRAGRGWLATGYFSGYPRSGYARIPGRVATRGDIVQFYWNSWSTRHGIHTAILTGPTQGGGAPVVDSNWVGYERIGEHWLDVASRLRSYPGLHVAFWRWRG